MPVDFEYYCGFDVWPLQLAAELFAEAGPSPEARALLQTRQGVALDDASALHHRPGPKSGGEIFNRAHAAVVDRRLRAFRQQAGAAEVIWVCRQDALIWGLVTRLIETGHPLHDSARRAQLDALGQRLRRRTPPAASPVDLQLPGQLHADLSDHATGRQPPPDREGDLPAPSEPPQRHISAAPDPVCEAITENGRELISRTQYDNLVARRDSNAFFLNAVAPAERGKHQIVYNGADALIDPRGAQCLAAVVAAHPAPLSAARLPSHGSATTPVDKALEKARRDGAGGVDGPRPIFPTIGAGEGKCYGFQPPAGCAWCVLLPIGLDADTEAPGPRARSRSR